MSIAFLACVEAGNLENQAVLLCRSIRKYAGRWAGAAIHCYQPRQGPPLRAETLRAMSEMGVMHHTEVLNRDFHGYPIGNKIFACADAEETLEENVLCFLDSDTVVLQEPSELELPEPVVAALRPVDHRGVGSEGPGDPRDAYWQRVYEAAGVAGPAYIDTVADHRRIRAYWNAGLIAVRRRSGIFRRWQATFAKLVALGLIPEKGMTNMDQVALAAVLAPEGDRVKCLDWRYNYPLPKRPLLKEPARSAGLASLVHVHYHRWFNKPGFLRLLRPAVDTESGVCRWLESYLPFEPITDEPLRF